MTTRELLAEVERAPKGPKVGAFFDFDGTLIDGYSASVFYQDRLRRLDFWPGELAKSVIAGVGIAVRGDDVANLMKVSVAGWAGHREEEVQELFDRLFRERIAGMVYPEARELVRAHRKAGHTVALASSATRFQLSALAEDLELDNVLCSEVEIVKGFFTGYVSRRHPLGASQGAGRDEVRARGRCRSPAELRVCQRRRGCAVPGDGRQAAGIESGQAARGDSP